MHFLLVALLLSTSFPLAKADSGAPFAPEIAAMKLALSPLLSPLRSDYADDIRAAEKKRMLMLSGQAEIEKKPGEKKSASKREYRCYLSPQEITSLVLRANPVTKAFRFKKDCDIDGTVSLSEKVFRVDLSLKEAGPYFRIRFLVELTSAKEENSGLVRMKARIYDGELYTAEREHEADFEFLADYALVLDGYGKLMAPGSGTVYVKKFRRQKIDRILPLAFEKK